MVRREGGEKRDIIYKHARAAFYVMLDSLKSSSDLYSDPVVPPYIEESGWSRACLCNLVERRCSVCVPRNRCKV